MSEIRDGFPVNMSGARRSRGIVVVLCFLFLAGCVTNRVKYDVPPVPLPERYSKAPTPVEAIRLAAEQGDVGKPSLSLTDVLPEWWTLLGNDELDGLVSRALNNNPDLRIATLRIAQMHARLGQANADELPTVTLPYQTKTAKPEGGIGTGREFERLRARNTYQLSLQGSWRVDVWGERSALYDSAEFQFQRAVFQRDDVQRDTIVSVVTSYAEYLALNDRLRVARESQTVLDEMLASVELRMEKGDATVIDVEQQRAAVHQVKATLPTLEQQRVVAMNRLASLLGTVPGELNLSDRGLETLRFPSVMPGMPSALLLRRPDVRLTEARLLGAEADIAVARSRLLPPLDLTAEVGYGSFFLEKLIRPYSFVGSLAANLALTVFDHGKREKEVAFTQAMREEMLETYIKVIYEAVREVDDALSSIRLMGRRLDSQQRAVESSRRAWHASIESYKALGIDFLVVLDTERSYHRNLDELHSARLDKYKGLVSLFGALGGGVPMAGELPGEGARPAALPNEADYGTLVRSAVAGVKKPAAEVKTETVPSAPASPAADAAPATGRVEPAQAPPPAKSDPAKVQPVPPPAPSGKPDAAKSAEPKPVAAIPDQVKPAVAPPKIPEAPRMPPPSPSPVPQPVQGAPVPALSAPTPAPAAAPAAAPATASAVAPPAAESGKGEGLEWATDEFWMVEIAGLHERSRLAAIWQEIKSRFAAQMADHILLPRRQEGEVPPRYRLFIARFQTAQAAESLCTALRETQYKCRTVSSRLLKRRAESNLPPAPSSPVAPVESAGGPK